MKPRVIFIPATSRWRQTSFSVPSDRSAIPAMWWRTLRTRRFEGAASRRPDNARERVRKGALRTRSNTFAPSSDACRTREGYVEPSTGVGVCQPHGLLGRLDSAHQFRDRMPSPPRSLARIPWRNQRSPLDARQARHRHPLDRVSIRTNRPSRRVDDVGSRSSSLRMLALSRQR